MVQQNLSKVTATIMTDHALGQWNQQVPDSDNTTCPTCTWTVDWIRGFLCIPCFSKSNSNKDKPKAPSLLLISPSASQQATQPLSSVIQVGHELSSNDSSAPRPNGFHDERVTQESTRPPSLVTGIGNRPSDSIKSTPSSSNVDNGSASQQSTSPSSVGDNGLSCNNNSAVSPASSFQGGLISQESPLSIVTGVDDELSESLESAPLASNAEDEPVSHKSTKVPSIIVHIDDMLTDNIMSSLPYCKEEYGFTSQHSIRPPTVITSMDDELLGSTESGLSFCDVEDGSIPQKATRPSFDVTKLDSIFSLPT
ncbi:hypothetical protein BGZ95_002877 [Linnemannia exigua]|uniref:Uncharacterized protein n=1 Tax=Linnemannia exigua TaxID=604196 RepID=A0AAD4DID4_9FUNG|nr:hypothetical protein BGZ95_002877 [Linnemannia exigua]